MDLQTYIGNDRGKQAQFCKDLPAHAPDLSRWLSGVRKPPVDRCPDIERVSGGAVTCEELRPDVKWHRVKDREWRWHKAGRPLVDVTAKQEA